MIMVESLHRPWHLPSLKLAQLARWEESLFAAYVTITIKKHAGSVKPVLTLRIRSHFGTGYRKTPPPKE